jgi:16S rRNA U516 pseudouridylate synthase RsuA-like enzyme
MTKNLTNGTYTTIIWTFDTARNDLMIIKTRVFELSQGKYNNLSELAQAMGLSISQIYRVRMGKRGINEKFLIGAKKAFPEYQLDELFYFSYGTNRGEESEKVSARQYHHAVRY